MTSGLPFSKSMFLILLFAFLLFQFLALTAVLADTIFVSPGAAWKYLDDGSDRGTAWRDTGFDDSGWASGPAQLGYGDGDEATVVSYGPSSTNKYVTTYFRRGFDVVDPSPYACFRLRLVRDDGAVVYLNGNEVRRVNMPDGPVDYLTLAPNVIGSDDEDAFQELYFYPTGLAAGANVIAVEIHQQSRTSSDISFDLEITGLDTLPTLMRKQPYLIYPGVNTEMEVHWQLELPESCTIEWGTDTSYSLGSARTWMYGTDFQHAHTITGLAPGTLYYYRVTVGPEEYPASFRAAPSDEATRVKFFAYGDTRTYPASHDAVAEDVIAACAADPDLQTMILSVGDLVSDGDIEDDWDDEFFVSGYPNIREMMATLPYQSCMGNHEADGLLFEKYFPYPFTAGRYWSFDYGPAHFAVVDQYVAYGTGSPQLTWLDDDLAASTKPWKFVYLHEPGWSAGGHANNTTVQSVIHPLLMEHGVIMLLAGHNHYYARAVVNDIHHVTTGGGGAPLYAPNPAYPYLVATAQAHHFCTIDIDGPVLHFEAVNTGSAIIDSFTVMLPGAGVARPGEEHAGFALGPASPSPSAGETRISFTVPRVAEIRLGIFDIGGRKVRTLLEGVAEPGTRWAVWNGFDDNGVKVSPGAYFCRLESGDVSISRKVVRLK
jgi:hypothetical protein